jgi:translation initiation factor 1
MPPNKPAIVWSSEQGDLRSKRAATPPKTTPPPRQQTVYLLRDSKGRKGKAVTLVKNLALPEPDLQALATQLKQACGAGGTVRDGLIEIQGEQREKLAGVLRKLGYQVKIAGG